MATGGEGFRFEHIVGAYYLASLLLQSGTYGLSRGTTKRVQLQRGAFDHPLDDLIVVADTAEGEAMLALQIKRNLNFTRADATFLKAMGQAWKEFSKPNFNRGPDRIGFVIALNSKDVDEHYCPVFHWASYSDSAQDFRDKLDENRPGLTGKKMRNFAVLLRDRLKVVANGDVGDEAFWQFCKSMVILQFDFVQDSSKDKLAMIEPLKRISRPAARASDLFLCLQEITFRGMSSVGSFNQASLRDLLAREGFSVECADTLEGTVQNLPVYPYPCFTGRKEVLQAIHDRFSQDGFRETILALSATGGFGKTQTALKYAHSHLEDYRAIFWFASSTESELKADFVEVAKRLGRSEADAPNPMLAVCAVLDWLEQHDRWLLIFDNADDPERITRFLPKLLRGCVLLTSRAETFDKLGGCESIPLDVMTPAEAMEFLTKRKVLNADDPEEIRAAEKLTKRLGYLPLALDQAAAFIEFHHFTIQKYLDRYLQQGLPWLEKGKPITKYDRTVATTWSLNFQVIESEYPDSADLLLVCAFLTPDDLSIDLIVRGARHLGSRLARALRVEDPELALAQLMQPLTQYSLIRYDRCSHRYQIHRLVQDAALYYARDDRGDEKWARRFLQAMELALPRANLSAREIVIHAEQALHALHFLRKDDDLRRTLELAMRAILGPNLIAVSGYASRQTEENYAQAQKLCHKLDPTRVTFPIAWGCWAVNYVQAKLKESESIGRSLLQQAKKSGRSGRGFCVEANRALGSSLFSLGSLAQASRHLLDAIERHDLRVDADHPKQYAVNPRIVCSGYQVVCASYTNGEDAGQAEVTRLSMLLQEEPHPFSKVFGSYWLACGEQVRNDGTRTLAAAQNVIRLSELHHFPQWKAMGTILEGWALASLGNLEEGIWRCREGILRHRATGARIFQPYFLLLLAQAYQKAASNPSVKLADPGPAESGLVAVEYAKTRADSTGEATWTAECLRVQAELILLSGPTFEAERLLREAAELASKQSAAAIQIRALASLCHHLRTSNRDSEAHAIQESVSQDLKRRAFPGDVATLDGLHASVSPVETAGPATNQ